jgi:ferredoxin
MKWSRIWFKINMKFWRFGNIQKKIARLPVIDKIIGPILYNEKNLDATYIPVGEAVDDLPGSVLPYQIIGDFVNQASKRFVLDYCLCREGNKCSDYPREIGCIFLGDAAGDIDSELGRPVTAQEAMEHVNRARGEGLLPNIIHGSFDASLLSIDYRRMLAVCFCCNCCCTFRSDMKKGPVAYRDRIIRLPGLVMTTGGDCAGCGTCAEVCFLGAIELGEDGPAFADFCKGCGRCADTCPRGNIHIRLDPEVDTESIILRRIGARTNIT